mmetsp:Transcript_4119/g.13947  ORF Transcript_4119/g.13947 Transcript_4119/m.13947 type:complete len:184 (+) Transcript_4119:1544-2095(+)
MALAPGWMLERSIADSFSSLDVVVGYLVERDTEFAPLCSRHAEAAKGAVESLSALHCKWALHAQQLLTGGLAVIGGAKEDAPDTSSGICEISPLVSYFGEGLTGLVLAGLPLSPWHIEHDGCYQILPGQEPPLRHDTSYDGAWWDDAGMSTPMPDEALAMDAASRPEHCRLAFSGSSARDMFH